VCIHKTSSSYHNWFSTGRGNVPVVWTTAHIAEKRRISKRSAPTVFIRANRLGSAVNKPPLHGYRKRLEINIIRKKFNRMEQRQ
jgi:hypothetical protein